jgi:HSP90 family molecular chaperone
MTIKQTFEICRQRHRHDPRRGHRKHRHHCPERHRRHSWRPWNTYQQGKGTLIPELIGQFGVGFYSAFIVAEKITLITRAAGADAGQGGANGFQPATDRSLSKQIEKAVPGHHDHPVELKKKEKDDKDFTDEWTIRNIVKQHSDFVNYPIVPWTLSATSRMPDEEHYQGQGWEAHRCRPRARSCGKRPSTP